MSLIDLLISGAMSLVHGIIGLFPAYTLPGSLSGFGNAIGSAVATGNSVFPVVTLGVCLSILFGLRLWLAMVDLAVWVYQLIPFKAS